MITELILAICASLSFQIEGKAIQVVPETNAAPNGRSGSSQYLPSDPPQPIDLNCTEETPIYDTENKVCVTQGMPPQLQSFFNLKNVLNFTFASSFLW